MAHRAHVSIAQVYSITLAVGMNYLIDKQQQLDELAGQLSGLSSVAVDTEFLREKTYNAKLCLVQLGFNGHQYCIDVLAIADLSALANLLVDTSILKIFHAASQDLEVLYQQFGAIPTPIYDTQLAAAFCGSDLQIGYAALVEQVTGVSLAKGQARTDWSKRPLSSAQLSYAGEDVEHLHALYESTFNQLNKLGRESWFLEELALLVAEENYQMNPALAFRRLNGGGFKIRDQYRLKALAQWREELAQERDIPRSWVIKDRAMYDIVALNPKKPEDLLNADLLGKKSGPRFAPQIIELFKHTQIGEERLWRAVEPLSKPEKKLCADMMKKTSQISEQEEIAQALLGTRKDIEKLFRFRQSKKLLKGWRNELIGQPLLDHLKAQQGG